MQQAISFERSRLVGVAAATTALGALTGNWAVCYAIGGFGLASYNIWRGTQVARWLTASGPEPALYEGLWAFLVSQIHRERQQNRKNRRDINQLLKRYRDSAEALPDAAVLIDNQRQIQWANSKARELLGIDGVADRGHRVDNLLRDPAVQPLFASHNPVREAQTQSPTDEKVRLTLRLSRFGSGALLVAHDISTILAAQEMRQTFVANASHELRTPLTVIAGHLELMADDPHTDADTVQSLRSAMRESDRMLMIVEDLLTLTSLEHSQLRDDQCVDIAVAAETRQAIEALTKTPLGAERNIAMDLDPTLRLRGRSSEIMSVVQNLLSNALRHTDAAGQITVRWQRDADGLPTFSVEDQGDGIAPEHLNHLTERFYRVDAGRSREIGGTGLGLSIVKHILSRHGGDLRIDSRLGEGSTFSARFPPSRAR